MDIVKLLSKIIRLSGQSDKLEKIDYDELDQFIEATSWRTLRDFLEKITKESTLFLVVIRGENYPENYVPYDSRHIPKPDEKHLHLLNEVNANFFRFYNHFSTKFGELILDYSLIQSSQFSKELVCVGYNMHEEVVQKKGNDIVFFLDYNSETGELDEPYQEFTLWHYVVNEVIVYHPEIYNQLKEFVVKKNKKSY